MAHILVVGSGIAGLFAAIRCADAGHTVSIVTKSAPRDSSTNWAQGGIAGILDKTDGLALDAHITDTIAAGDGHCDEEIVRIVCREAGDRIRDLLSIGVKFDTNLDGEFDLAKEGGHSSSRILHAKDATGAEIEGALMAAVRSSELISMYPDHLAVDLILDDKNAKQKDVVGIWCLDDSEMMVTFAADAILIATGGAGQLYRHTTNPHVACGDGIAMSIRAGALTRDMEFVQFHPTALALEGDRPFLITEALRGHGAVLLTRDEYVRWKEEGGSPENYSFTLKYSPSGSLATRDIVARATDEELKRSGQDSVFLVTEHLGKDVVQRFPTIESRLQRHGISLAEDPLPVSPAAHYFVGGLAVDDNGGVLQAGLERVIGGLYAIGEVACTGMHGANRLASNSLLEAVVFAHRASEHLIAVIQDTAPRTLPEWRADEMVEMREHSPLVHDRRALQSTMTDDVGLVKSNARLQRAERRLALLKEEVERLWQRCKPSKELVQLRNMVQVARRVCSSSIARKTNIGLHYNKDLI
ncbi:MAG: L-aspartate oxidase [Candidatus Poseidoniaceae archaeon]|nr:L-aspartate oxidase [Candidatus Poseidoniaceae archaeon]